MRRIQVITEQWREGCYVIDFKVGQNFGEPQGSEMAPSRITALISNTDQ